MGDRPHPDDMTQIGRLLYDMTDSGVSFDKLAARARAQGHKMERSRLQQIASGNKGKRLTDNAIRAVAAALGMGPLAIAILDDEDHFGARPTRPPQQRRRSAS